MPLSGSIRSSPLPGQPEDPASQRSHVPNYRTSRPRGFDAAVFRLVREKLHGVNLGLVNIAPELHRMQFGGLKRAGSNPPARRLLPPVNWHRGSHGCIGGAVPGRCPQPCWKSCLPSLFCTACPPPGGSCPEPVRRRESHGETETRRCESSRRGVAGGERCRGVLLSGSHFGPGWRRRGPPRPGVGPPGDPDAPLHLRGSTDAGGEAHQGADAEENEDIRETFAEVFPRESMIRY